MKPKSQGAEGTSRHADAQTQAVSKGTLLILEDDQRLATSLRQEFLDRSYQVILAHRLADIPTDVVFEYAIVDLRLDNGDSGLDAIPIIKTKSPEARILVLSGYGSITTAVEAVKRGAIDYLTKPASSQEIEAALNGEKLQTEADFKRRSLSDVEHEYIDFVLTRNEGNISKTAKDLGLHRQSLQRKLKKYL